MVRKNDKKLMALIAEIAGRPVSEVHEITPEHGAVVVVTAFTMRVSAEERARIKREVEARSGVRISLC